MDAVSDVMCEAETLEFVDMARLETVITEVSMTTNKYLTKVLLNKYRLLHHCRAMKQYLLLGQVCCDLGYGLRTRNQSSVHALGRLYSILDGLVEHRAFQTSQ